MKSTETQLELAITALLKAEGEKMEPPVLKMNKSEYNPAIHHRRSIRLKGHDYAGGGLYFVTLCAHREFIAWAGGKPFGANGAGATERNREIIAEEWARSGAIRDDVFPGEFVVMPDHFHGLIRIEKGASELGHVVGVFKAAVSKRIRRGGTHVAHGEGDKGDMRAAHGEGDKGAKDDKRVARTAPAAPQMRIWHRNYYEVIVRSAEAEQKIAEYIQMNP